MLIDEDSATDLRELISDDIHLHFDENYEPTETGIIMESLIDKLYIP